jgi:hypothetical protein
MQRGGERGQDQKLPEEPHLPIRPEGQRQEMPGIGGDARIDRRYSVSGIKSERNEHHHGEDKGRAEPQEPVAQEPLRPFSHEARPCEQTREKEQQRHQIDVLPAAKNIEPKPATAVDNRKGAPSVRGLIEWKRLWPEPAKIGRDRMEGDEGEDGDGAQIVQRHTGFRHAHCDAPAPFRGVGFSPYRRASSP